MTPKSLLVSVLMLATVPAFSSDLAVDFDGKSTKAENIIDRLNDKAVNDAAVPPISESSLGSTVGISVIVDDRGETKEMWPPGTRMYATPKTCSWQGHTGYYAVCLAFTDQPIGHNHTVPAPPSVRFIDESVPYPGAEEYFPHCYLRVPLNQGGATFKWGAPEHATNLKMRVSYLPSPGGPHYCEDSGYWTDLVFGISEMQQLQPGLGYNLDPGTKSHPDIHFGQLAAVNGLQAIAAQYIREFPLDSPLPIMRISLPKGGLLDIDDTWIPPLVHHRLGWEVDVKSVYISQEHRSRFQEIVKAAGAQIVACPGQYYHIDFTPQTPAHEDGPVCD